MRVELDVRKSKDGEIVITTMIIVWIDCLESRKNIADTTVAQLKEISGVRDSTLDEVLTNSNIDLIREIKVHGIEAKKYWKKLKNFHTKS